MGGPELMGKNAKERRRARDTPYPSTQLRRIYRRDMGFCQLCHEPCATADASREHLIRLVDGGSNKDSNIVLAHTWCNNAADRAIVMDTPTTYTSQSENYETEEQHADLNTPADLQNLSRPDGAD